MNKKLIKKCISLIMCVVIFFCININHINAAEIEQVKYQQVNSKIKASLDQNIQPAEIFQNLSDSEIETLKNVYRSYNLNSDYGFSSEIVENPEVHKIDNLANIYYDYYSKNGELPETVYLQTDEFSNNIDLKVESNLASAADYSTIMQGLGYSYTVNQIAIQLVKVGTYIGISSALPFLNLVALIVGMGIITFSYISIAYSAVAVGANNLILSWYIRSAEDLLNARQTTARVIAEKERGTEYWLAFLVNYKGLGGIRVTNPLTQSRAKDIVKANQLNPNVFTYDFSHAAYLATLASPIYGFKPHEPHKIDVQTLNMYHIHTYVAPGVLGKTHIFYLT